MEVKFMKKQIACLQPVVAHVQTQEQTQELKLPDGFPDIGKILGCWGQPMIRSKEWRRTSMNVSGGVMAWVLYMPEEDEIPRVMDAWIPFQMRWEFPESLDDGNMLINPILSNLDARNVSARKIILRAGVELMGQAMAAEKVEMTVPVDIPEDVQLLTQKYPVNIPVEAGEKQIALEDDVALADANIAVQRMIGYTIAPAVQEARILANRLVMRGNAHFKMRYMTSDGQMRMYSKEIPFSEYTELDRDYEENADTLIVPILTALEVDLADDMHLMIRGNVAAQYTVFDRTVAEVTEDAYSPHRDVTVHTEGVNLPVLLDNRKFDVPVSGETAANHPIDIEAFPKQPHLRMDEDGRMMHLSGGYQTVSTDDGMEMVRFEGDCAYPADEGNQTQLWLGYSTDPEYKQNADENTISSVYPVTALAYSGKAIEMVTGLTLGEVKEATADKPSIILRRANDEGLWAMAKKCGSTMDAIRAANHLEQEPEEGRMLLIPVV